jgi:WD40 repeat protein
MRPLSGHLGPVTALAFAPGGRLLASAGWDGSVRLWDVATATQTDHFQGPHSHARCLSLSPDGRRLYAGYRRDPTVVSGNALVLGIDPATGRFAPSRQFWTADPSVVNAVAAVPGNRGVVVGGAFGCIVFNDPDQRGQVVETNRKGVAAVAASADGALLATLSSPGDLIVWDAVTHRQVNRMYWWATPGRALAFAPRGSLLAAGAGNTVLFWDPMSPVPARRRDAHADEVLAVAFNPAGTIAASADRDGLVVWHDAVSGDETGRFDWQLGSVFSVAFAPDGLTAAAGGEQGDILLWDVDVGGTGW